MGANDCTKNRVDAVTILGVEPDDPDQIPIAPPSGFVWMAGGGMASSDQIYGIAEVRVVREGGTLDFVMTLDDALSLRDLLDQTIESMRKYEAHSKETT